MAVAEVKEEVKSLKELYDEFIEDGLKAIEEALEDNFPGHWEITKSSVSVSDFLIGSQPVTAKNKTLLDKACAGLSESNLRARTKYTIIIHIPELHVRNSGGRNEKITDMYIRMCLNPFLSDADGNTFTGMRTSYTMAQLMSGFTFSHMHQSAGSRGWSHFCLGDTDFAHLCLDIKQRFNKDKFYLFLLQLPKYLSWESLEGGPYRYISEIVRRSNSGSSAPNINHIDLHTCYRKFLADKLEFDTEIVSSPHMFGIKVLLNDKFKANVTKTITNKRHYQIYDPVTKRLSYQMVNSAQDEADRLLRQYNAAPYLKFKDKDIMLSITDMDQSPEKEIDFSNAVADERIVNFIKDKLEILINNRISNEFRTKGTIYQQEKRVNVTG